MDDIFQKRMQILSQGPLIKRLYEEAMENHDILQYMVNRVTRIEDKGRQLFFGEALSEHSSTNV